MKTIYKYRLFSSLIESEREVQLPIPTGAEILHVGADPNGYHCLWAKVDPSAPVENVKIYAFSTGYDLVPDGLTHLATILEGPFVWHLFR